MSASVSTRMSSRLDATASLPAIVEAENLNFFYGAKQALSDISLTIRRVPPQGKRQQQAAGVYESSSETRLVSEELSY